MRGKCWKWGSKTSATESILWLIINELMELLGLGHYTPRGRVPIF